MTLPRASNFYNCLDSIRRFHLLNQGNHFNQSMPVNLLNHLVLKILHTLNINSFSGITLTGGCVN